MTYRKIASASFNRPANVTAYADGDLVANNVTAGQVVAAAIAVARIPGGKGAVKRLRLAKSGTDVTNASFKVHLFTQAPTVANGDNGAFGVTNGLARGYLGSVSVTVDRALGDGAFGAADCDIMFDAAANSSNLFALVAAAGAYTPASAETFTVTLEVERD